MNRHVIGELLHRLAHRIDPWMCRCQVDAYQKGWRVQREQQERRARLMAEEGLPVAAEDFENWLRRRAA